MGGPVRLPSNGKQLTFRNRSTYGVLPTTFEQSASSLNVAHGTSLFQDVTLPQEELSSSRHGRRRRGWSEWGVDFLLARIIQLRFRVGTSKSEPDH